MAIAQGITKSLRYKKETTWGTLAGATGASVLRRVTGTFNLKKDTYQSNEIRTDYQIADYRHGIRSSEGSLNGELSPGSYSDFFAAALARNFTTGATATGVSVTIAGTGPSYTVTRAAGSYLTDGFKVGDVIRLSVGTLNAANINKNLIIASLTATVATVYVLNASLLVAEGPITGTTITVVGKKTYTPLTGHTDDSFTFEEWYSDIARSEVYTGNKVGSSNVQIPANGLATVDFSFMGKDLAQTGSTQYFTTPTAQGTSGIVAGVNGLLLVNGAPVGLVTSADFSIARNLTMEPVVGANTVPDIFEGRVNITGNFSAFFQDGILAGYFDDETEIALIITMTTSNLANADFVSFTLPRIKVGSADKNDGETGIVRSFSFQALLNTAGGTGTSTEATTLSVQDSLAL